MDQGLPGELGWEMCRPPRLAGVPMISSLAQPHSPPQRHRRLFASCELLPILFCDSDMPWRAAGFPLRLPVHSAAFSRSDLQADVMSNFTGKSPSPRLSLTENSRSRIRRGNAARTPQRMLRRCPASSAQATNWLSEAGGEGSKRAEEMGLERVGVGDWKAPIIK